MNQPVLPLGALVIFGPTMLRLDQLETMPGHAAPVYVLVNAVTGEQVRFPHATLVWLVRNGSGSAMLTGPAAGMWS